MKPLRHPGAGGTSGRRLIRTGCDDDVIGGGHDTHDCEAGRDRGNMRMGKEDLHQGGLLYVLIRDCNDSTASAGEPELDRR